MSMAPDGTLHTTATPGKRLMRNCCLLIGREGVVGEAFALRSGGVDHRNRPAQCRPCLDS